MQPDGNPLLSGIEERERGRLRAVKARRDDQDRCGVNALALDQIADRRIDRGGNAVVVGAKPDLATGRRMCRRHSAAERVAGSLSRRAPSAVFRLCSATKYTGRAFSSERIFPIYSPMMPIMINCTPPITIRPT